MFWSKRLYVFKKRLGVFYALQFVHFQGDGLAAIPISVVCVALLVWVTLTDARVQKIFRQKESF